MVDGSAFQHRRHGTDGRVAPPDTLRIWIGGLYVGKIIPHVRLKTFEENLDGSDISSAKGDDDVGKLF